MPLFAGKSAAFSIDGVTLKAKEWNLSIEYGRIDVTNFESDNDWREYLNGFASGTIRAKGPHDPSLAIPSTSSQAAFTCTIGGPYQLTGNCWVTKLNFSTDIDGAAMFELEAAVTGNVDIDLS